VREVRRPDGEVVQEPVAVDVLGSMSRAMHTIRVRPREVQTPYGTSFETPAGVTGGAVWPTGLAIDLILAAGALWLTARRLRTPSDRLAKGQRIA
jgi:hypothetical protein